MSIAITPEGTRSVGPSPGSFRRDAFHLAMQAGVPIVPVIIRNTGSLMWRNAKTLRGGTVQVLVLPPIPTAGWTHGDIRACVDEVHRLYVDALEDWPATPSAVTLGRRGRPRCGRGFLRR